MVKDCRKVTVHNIEEYWLGRLSASVATEVKSHLAQCKACRLKSVTVRAEMLWLKHILAAWAARQGERRRSERRPAHGLVRLDVLTNQGDAAVFAASLRDESEHGIGLICQRHCTPGESVRVWRQGTALSGVVRYCRPVGDVFMIGMELKAA